MTIEDYFKEKDKETLIYVNEGCKSCGKITLSMDL